MDGRGPYGLACMTCFKAKSKCVARPDGDGCQRCHRLKKQCNPSDSVRRRSSQKSQSSQISQLEAKLDSLVSLLDHTHGVAATLPPALPQISPVEQASSSQSIKTSISHPSTLPAVYYLPTRDPEEALATFRRMLRFCPFIYLPPDYSAQQLEHEQPFLFQVILSVTSWSMQEKRVRAKEIKTTLAQATVVENRSNIDLLVALLAFVAWGNDTYLSGGPTISRLMEIALSVIYQLRLNKPLPANSHMLAKLGARNFCLDYDNADHHSLGEQRAVLGGFLMASAVSMYFGHIDPMHWTPQMEGFLRTLEANVECHSDQVLASLVRLELVALQAMQIQAQHESELLIPFCFTALRSQLQEVHDSMSPELQKDDVVMIHFHAVELIIHETGLPAQGAASSHARTPTPDSRPVLSWERLDCMWRSMRAIQSWFKLFLGLQRGDYEGLTYHMWSQLSRTLLGLFRLSSNTDPAWDRAAVCRTLDILEVVERITENVDQLAPKTLEPVLDDWWVQVGRLCRGVRAWLRAQLGVERTEKAHGSNFAGDAFMWEVFNHDMNPNIIPALQFANDAWPDGLAGWAAPGNPSMGMLP